MDVRIGLYRKLNAEELCLNCGVGEDSRARSSNQSMRKEVIPEYSLE